MDQTVSSELFLKYKIPEKLEDARELIREVLDSEELDLKSASEGEKEEVFEQIIQTALFNRGIFLETFNLIKSN